MLVTQDGAKVYGEGPDHSRRTQRDVRFPGTFAELRRAVEAAVAKECPEAEVLSGEDCVEVRSRTETAMIHPVTDGDEYSAELHPVVRPKACGLVLRISPAPWEDPIDRFRWEQERIPAYYWSTFRETGYLRASGRYVTAEWKMEPFAYPIGLDWSGYQNGPGIDEEFTRPLVVRDRLIAAIRRHLDLPSRWRLEVQPRLVLGDAFRIAEKALGDEAASRYFMDARLWPGPPDAEAEATWFLFSCAEDCSVKAAAVSMKGEATVFDIPRGWLPSVKYVPFHWWYVDRSLLCHRRNVATPKCPGQMDEIQRRLEALFARHSVHAKIRVRGDTLVASRDLRDYYVHPRIEDDDGLGEDFHPYLVRKRGPSRHGFFLRVRYHDDASAERLRERRGGGFLGSLRPRPEYPYWQNSFYDLVAAEDGRSCEIELRLGTGDVTPIRAVQFLWAICGIEPKEYAGSSEEAP